MRSLFYLYFFYLLGTGYSIGQTQSGIQLGARNFWFSAVRECRSPGLFSRPPAYFRIGADGAWTRTGFMATRLEPYFQTDPLAMRQLGQFRAHKWISAGFAVGAAGCSLGFLRTFSQAIFSIDRPQNGQSRLIDNPLFWLGAEIGCGLGAAIFRVHATRHLQQAVSAYNQGITACPGLTSPLFASWQPTLTVFPEIGAGINLTF